uniref:Cuticle protein n=1 Tax=Parastrongyloides trichosuri TaxID=131310 RepID=A0A0N4Z9S7_PARTI
MNSKIIIALIAAIIASTSAQYYYASPAYGYAGYAGYYGYPAAVAAYAAPPPVVAAPAVASVVPSVVPSAFAPLAYAWGSNKNGTDKVSNTQENVKLTN